MRTRRVYKKTVSIVNEKATDMYESMVGTKKGFLLESYDKNYDRIHFLALSRRKSLPQREMPW